MLFKCKCHSFLHFPHHVLLLPSFSSLSLTPHSFHPHTPLTPAHLHSYTIKPTHISSIFSTQFSFIRLPPLHHFLLINVKLCYLVVNDLSEIALPSTVVNSNKIGVKGLCYVCAANVFCAAIIFKILIPCVAKTFLNEHRKSVFVLGKYGLNF